jgi:KUP system potassium uptake protein
MSQMRPGHAKAGMAALTFGALGVVFGDIGTSPLYALQTVFTHDNHAVPTTDSAVYGVVSLVFWTITLIVSIKYVTFIMRADNEGEGGIMALIALIRNAPAQRRVAAALLVALGIFGASLFYGDGMITPAISVLSAVEGLKVIDSGLKDLVLPITVAILTALFAIQRLGTHVVGRAFGPVMALWFLVLAVMGVGEVVKHPGILRALSPSYGVEFLFDHGGTAFIALGSVVLTITGAEALYADMGHFGRSPIRRAWFLLVFPALILNYMGQGALILRDPSAVENPFFLLAPEWSRIPMVLLATAATVIASQAVISGAFSVTRQAVRLGFLPRLTIRHTSAEIGQVYVPAVNWLIFVAVIALVLGFRSSAHLASAYGVAVTGTLAIDTLLFFYVVRNLWRKPLWLSVIGCLSFLLVDLTFFTANLTKVFHGGWFPLTIALAVYVILTTWQRGRGIVTRNRVEEEGPLRSFVDELRDLQPYRAPGTGVYLNANSETTPLAMRAAVEHLNALHQSVVIVSLQTTNVPHVPAEERLEIDDLGYRDDGILHITAHFGFQDETDVPKVVHAAARRPLECDITLDNLSYFVSRITIVLSDSPGMAHWRKKLFLGIARNAGNPVEYFSLPEEQTVVFGSLIPL